MTRPRAGLLGGLVFVAAQALSLLANYGFQLLAARKLPPADYVALFGWLAELAAYGVLAIVATNVALTKPPEATVARMLRMAGVIVAVATVLAALLVPRGVSLVAVVPVVVAVGYASGVALARQSFVLAAVGATVVFLVRVAWFAAQPSRALGERATLMGFGLGLLVLCIGDATDARPAVARTASVPLTSTLGRALLLSVAQAVAPVADYLLLRSSVPESMQHAWASGSLLLRVPVVLGMGVLQVTLAKRTAAAREHARLERWVPAIEVAMPTALAVFALLPLQHAFARVVALVVGGEVGAYDALPVASMFWSAGATLALLASLQIAHVRRNVRAPVMVGVVVALGALAVRGLPTLAWPTKLAVLAALWTSFAAAVLALGARRRAENAAP